MKFYIGFPSDINVSEGLVQYKSAEEAAWNTEEWCTVEADTLQEAFDGYEKAFELWRGEQSKLHPKP